MWITLLSLEKLHESIEGRKNFEGDISYYVAHTVAADSQAPLGC